MHSILLNPLKQEVQQVRKLMHAVILAWSPRPLQMAQVISETVLVGGFALQALQGKTLLARRRVESHVRP
jgi:hypothetical protein